MTEQTVYVRHAGWIESMVVESDNAGILTTTMTRCFKAVCMPDGSATIERWRDGSKVYDGFGSWCSAKIDLPTGTMIKIKRGTKIWSMIDLRYRTIDTALTVQADRDDYDEIYTFRYDGQIWIVGMEEV